MAPPTRPRPPARKASETPEVRAFLGLMRLHEQLSADLAGVLRAEGLSAPQYNVLRILRSAGAEGVPCRSIAERMVNRVPDVTRLVDRLEDAGLARRERSSEDRRVVRVAISSSGLEALARLDRPVLAAHERQFEALEPGELACLEGFLERLLAGHPIPPCDGRRGAE